MLASKQACLYPHWRQEFEYATLPATFETKDNICIVISPLSIDTIALPSTEKVESLLYF